MHKQNLRQRLPSEILQSRILNTLDGPDHDFHTASRLGLPHFALSTTVSAVPAVAQADTAAADAAYVPTQTFDVVSIHESKVVFRRSVRMGGPNSPHSCLVSLTNERATDLVAMAYGVDGRNVSGGPDLALRPTSM